MEFRVDEEHQEHEHDRDHERDTGQGDAQGNLEFGMEKVSLKVSLRAAVFFVGLGIAAAATAILKLVSQVIEIMGQMRK